MPMLPGWTANTSRAGVSVEYRFFHEAINLFRHKLTMEIITELNQHDLRYTDLMQAVTLRLDGPLHSKSFIESLKRLQDHGLIIHVDDGDVSRYILAPAGRDLVPLLLTFERQLHAWGATHVDQLPWSFQSAHGG
ncbi:MAG: helix-turn-helix transcriptional regulator [Actinobacteria bacterium]|nr:helix-turn-helix transcriptional regulator [Actinomycetota bacterium]